MRFLITAVMLLLTACTYVAPATFKAERTGQFNAAELAAWYGSNLPRGGLSTKGDFPYRRQRNRLPRREFGGWKAIICAGAGCKLKIPFVFTKAHLDKVAADMRSICTEDTPECELKALRKAMVTMELQVYRERLRPLTRHEHNAYSVEGFRDYGARFTMDCVDQATNGTSYLLILIQHGLVKHYRVIHPGRINILIFQPHYFTRIQEMKSGHTYRFDLYHRGRFGVPPGVIRLT